MRKDIDPILMRGRRSVPQAGFVGSEADRLNGVFEVWGPCATDLRIVASMADVDLLTEGWEHVSVSTKRRCPNWQEMCFAKDLFWEPEETVIQLHPPRSQWISNHPFCLHLWRDSVHQQRLPPSIMVGLKALGTLK